MAQERIQKILAHAGIASRRAAEKLMLEGRVTVNGQVVDKLGAQADLEQDHIKVDGKLLRPTHAPRSYYLAFKPRDMITTLSDPEGRPTIADLLRAAGIRKRVYPVGRLDWDADGALLLTDDGDLANKVMHPRSHLPKIYRLRVKGNPAPRDLDRVRRGLVLEPGIRTLPAEVFVEAEEESGTRLRVTLVEGRQNQLKKMFERIGHPVRRLRRVQIGPLRLGGLKVGQIRPLSSKELSALREALERPDEHRPLSPRPSRPAAKAARRRTPPPPPSPRRRRGTA